MSNTDNKTTTPPTIQQPLNQEQNASEGAPSSTSSSKAIEEAAKAAGVQKIMHNLKNDLTHAIMVSECLRLLTEQDPAKFQEKAKALVPDLHDTLKRMRITILEVQHD